MSHRIGEGPGLKTQAGKEYFLSKILLSQLALNPWSVWFMVIVSNTPTTIDDSYVDHHNSENIRLKQSDVQGLFRIFRDFL